MTDNGLRQSLTSEQDNNKTSGRNDEEMVARHTPPTYTSDIDPQLFDTTVTIISSISKPGELGNFVQRCTVSEVVIKLAWTKDGPRCCTVAVNVHRTELTAQDGAVRTTAPNHPMRGFHERHARCCQEENVGTLFQESLPCS